MYAVSQSRKSQSSECHKQSPSLNTGIRNNLSPPHSIHSAARCLFISSGDQADIRAGHGGGVQWTLFVAVLETKTTEDQTMKCHPLPSLPRRYFHSLAIPAGILIISAAATLSLCGADEDEKPLGNPPLLEHSTPSGATETAQRLVPFPFTPPDVKLKEKEALSGSNDWFTKHDKDKIDQLGSLDFFAPSGPQSAGVVPKLHNTSAGIEIYELAPPLSKETFERAEGPYRSGITKKYSNKRSGKKVAKFKAGSLAESGLAAYYISRLLGHLVDVPPATYRTMDVQEFSKVGSQAGTTGNTSCTAAWANLRSMVRSGNPKIVLSGGKLVYGSLAVNPRGEDSSPEDYWTVSRIRAHSFYRVLSSRSPVANILKLDDVKCLQDLALAQDMTRGVILDSIFKQVDRLGNISIDLSQHYVTKEGKVKWDDKPSDKDKADAASPLLPLKRIVYKDNDDGMNWGLSSISVTPILNDTHHLDQTVYSRLQWLASLMQDSEPGSDAKVKEFFVNSVHISGDNYEKMKASLIKQAASLKSRVDSKDILLDLDFEGTMKKIYANAPAGGPAEPPVPNKPPLPVIASSVGRWEKGAKNLPGDVTAVQRLLKAAADKSKVPQIDPKGIDGKIGHPPGTSNTVSAIEAFQSRSSKPVDGLIEPNSETWNALLKATE